MLVLELLAVDAGRFDFSRNINRVSEYSRICPTSWPRRGWLKNRYGVSWQIAPEVLYELIGDPDREKPQRVMAAMRKMKKIEIAELERAAAAA